MAQQEAGAYLNKQRDLLACAITEALLERQQQQTERFQLDYQTLLGYAHHDLSKLFFSIVTQRPKLFADYIVWQRTMLEQREVPLFVVRENLTIFRNTILQNAPEYYHPYIELPIMAGMAELDKQLILPNSFIHKGAPEADIAQQYLDLLLAGERSGALEYIQQELDKDLALESLFLNVIQPVQHEVGRLWQINEINVAQEHFCTSTTQMLMAQLYPRVHSTSRTGKRVVSACIGNELHDIGIQIVTNFFEINGWDTYYIGANTPLPSIVQILKEQQVDLLAISVTMTPYLLMAKNLLDFLRTTEMKDTLVIVGGNAFNQTPNYWRQINANGFATNASRAVEIGLKLTA